MRYIGPQRWRAFVFNDLQLPGGKAGLLKGPRAPSGGGGCRAAGEGKESAARHAAVRGRGGRQRSERRPQHPGCGSYLPSLPAGASPRALSDAWRAAQQPPAPHRPPEPGDPAPCWALEQPLERPSPEPESTRLYTEEDFKSEQTFTKLRDYAVDKT
ncbi:translation initiation factor IF-2-like [Malaclemys terrapin pileata]|uniref:translation initiation factor IF-2-like n=1 Tax=Malaclemys terrapin pileata TaxID=2991368 RepID=UPI0023A87709|nr:translation initiation factor IF-2-like [Malaclemys terrapin pileata]